MASKDRYSVGIKCPTCAQKGTLHLSENDYPFMRKVGRGVEGIDGDFKADMTDDITVAITCTKCGDDFSYPPKD